MKGHNNINNKQREIHPSLNANKTFKSKTVVSSILEQHFRYDYLKRGYARIISNPTKPNYES